MAEKEQEHTKDVLDDLGMADVEAPDDHGELDDVESPEETEEAPEQEEPDDVEPESATTEDTSEEQPGQEQEEADSPTDPAQLAALQQSLEEEKRERKREKDAMLREIVKLRRSRQQDAGTEEQKKQQFPDKIPVEFGDDGQPYISTQTLATLMAGDSDPIQRFRGTHMQMAQSLVLEDPTALAAANQKYQEAYQVLDEAVRYAQIEYDQATPDVDSMMDLLERSGLDKKFIEQYPEIARDERDLEDFLNSTTTLNPKRMRRVLTRIAGHSSEERAPDSEDIPSKNVNLAARKIGAKPKPMHRGSRGKAPKQQSKLDILEAKSPFEWTEADSKAFLKEMEQVEAAEAAENE